MSPSESDLRAALHDGEGASPNVDTLILGARARAAQRRVRLLSTAAIVALVAGAGVGGAFLANGGSNSTATSDAAGGGVSNALRVPAATAGAAAGGTNQYAASVPACSGSSAQERTSLVSGRKNAAPNVLFSIPASTVVICEYSHSPANRVVLRGAQAGELIESLKKAPAKRPSGACPMIRMQPRPILIIALDRDGVPTGVASTDLGVPVCNIVVVTDGATRYSWMPPVDVAAKLAKLAPGSAVSAPSPTSTH